MCTSLPVLLSSDIESHLHRVQKMTLSEQTLMEILVSEIDDHGVFQNADGEFRDLSEWGGVHVQFGEYVKRIIWNVDTLYDIFAGEDESVLQPEGSIDMQWLPPKLTDFEISNMLLKGTVDTESLPRSLEVLCIDDNRLEGPFHLHGLPATIKKILGSRNSFSGSFDLAHHPPHLTKCDMSKNEFSGCLEIPKLPACVFHLNLERNRFCSPIDLSVLPVNLEFLCLHRNEFKQEKLVVDVHQNEVAFIRIGRESFSEVVSVSGEPVTEDFVK